jgi:hypothetical protein
MPIFPPVTLPPFLKMAHWMRIRRNIKALNLHTQFELPELYAVYETRVPGYRLTCIVSFHLIRPISIEIASHRSEIVSVAQSAVSEISSRHPPHCRVITFQ